MPEHNAARQLDAAPTGLECRRGGTKRTIRKESSPLKDTGDLDGALAGGARWREHVEVDEPCTAVKFGVDGLDEEWLGLVLGGVFDLHDDDTSDELWGQGCAPAHDHRVASVPQVKDLERDIWLRALAGHERGAGVEGWLAELEDSLEIGKQNQNIVLLTVAGPLGQPLLMSSSTLSL